MFASPSTECTVRFQVSIFSLVRSGVKLSDFLDLIRSGQRFHIFASPGPVSDCQNIFWSQSSLVRDSKFFIGPGSFGLCYEDPKLK